MHLETALGVLGAQPEDQPHGEQEDPVGQSALGAFDHLGGGGALAHAEHGGVVPERRPEQVEQVIGRGAAIGVDEGEEIASGCSAQASRTTAPLPRWASARCSSTGG